jgi:peptidyl-prolyl cis-trans isomerase SurA
MRHRAESRNFDRLSVKMPPDSQKELRMTLDGRFSLASRMGEAAVAMLLVAALGCLADAPAHASAIKVLVNDQPITDLDIQQRGKMMSIFTHGKEGEKQAVDQLIDEALMMQEAKRRNVDIGDEQVAAEFTTRAKAAKLSTEQFSQALRQAGISPQTFKDFLRANMAWGRIVRARFKATVDVSEQDVTAALAARDTSAAASPEAQQTAYEYRLQAILFVIPSGGAAGLEAKRRAEANAFRTAFQGCDHALEQAAGSPDIVVKPQTRREQGQLTPDLKAAFAKLDVGGITDPQRVAEGIQIVAICAKNAIAGQTEATVEVREEISNERGQLLARRYLRDLRSDAVIEYR